jgi:tripeptide aminopeptidase
MDLFPLKKAKASACYTFDGGKAAEIEADVSTPTRYGPNFRKGHPYRRRSGKVGQRHCHGLPLRFHAPPLREPRSHRHWYGYYCPIEIQGSMEKATVDIFLRDFSAQGMEQRIGAIKAFAAAVEAQFPLGKVKLDIKKQYLNMKEKLDQNPAVLEKLAEAIRQAEPSP